MGPWSGPDRRGERRYAAELGAGIEGGGIGRTRDVSLTGAYLILDPGFAPPERFTLTLRLGHDHLSPPLLLRSEASVVRTDRLATGLGLAIRVHGWVLAGGREAGI